MGRRSHSKISQMEPELRETIDEMIKNGIYYDDIVSYIKEQGISISRSAVGKYAKNLLTTLSALRISQENFRAIMEETERYPNLDMTDGILRLVSNQLLTAVSKLPEEQLETVDFDTLVKQAVALTRAAAYKKRTDMQNKEMLEIGSEQFQMLIFEAMAAKDPELYKKVRKFIKEEQKS